jgi:hypothetical protein
LYATYCLGYELLKLQSNAASSVGLIHRNNPTAILTITGFYTVVKSYFDGCGTTLAANGYPRSA